MGCGTSSTNSGKLINSGKGVIPKKIEAVKNTNVFIQDIVYLFGGSKILQFDIKTLRITETSSQPSFKLPKRTGCEYLRHTQQIATLGGTIDGKTVPDGYLFTPPNFSQAQKLPDYPMPIRYATLAYFNGVLYSVGGETEGTDPDNILKEIYSLRLAGGMGNAWEKVCDLPIPRRSANVLIANNQLYVFGGYSGNANRSTQIDSIDLTNKTANIENYRLPLGVEGARLCWHGDKILLIGGKRAGDRPDANTLCLNFKKKSIMSMRDLNAARDFPLVIPIKIDEVIVIGGGNNRTAERRAWNEEIQDYDFKGTQVDGENLLENPSHYKSALPTFIDTITDGEHFPDIDVNNRFIFGNEIDCFLIEVPSNLLPIFYASPMKLQQKTGQVSIRTDPNTVFLAGGTDVTRSKISNKVYKFTVKSKEIIELPRMNHARYFPTIHHDNGWLYVIGGKTKGARPSPSIERININGGTAWEELKHMHKARFGHQAWISNGKIYVVGGTTEDRGKPISEVEVFDIASNNWSTHRNLHNNLSYF